MFKKRLENRLQISFTEEEMAILDEYSELSKMPKSQIISRFFRDAQIFEVLKNGIEILKEMEEAKKEYEETQKDLEEELNDIKTDFEKEEYLKNLVGKLSKNTDFAEALKYFK